MNTKDFLRLAVPLGEATRRASAFAALWRDKTDFVAQYVLRGGDTAKLEGLARVADSVSLGGAP